MAEELEQTGEPGDDVRETLSRENEALSLALQSREAEIAQLGRALSAGEEEQAALRKSLEEARWQLDEIGKSLPQAVAAYRALAVRANPAVPAEMVAGDTIEEVDESLEKARALVERVRTEMESEAARARVPAGAPPRAPLDLSALSPREKIRYAVGGSPS